MYSPKIREEFIKEMYRVRVKTGKPITQQANEAIEGYIKGLKNILEKDQESLEKG